MRYVSVGQIMFALGLAGLGALSLFSGDFPYTWEPVPAWVPMRELLAHLSGLLLIVAALALLIRRIAAPAALALTVYLLGWVLVLQLPRAAQAPGNLGMWLGVAESTVLFAGGWTLFASLADTGGRTEFLTRPNALLFARVLFALACLVLGLSHFVYNGVTAGMIPSWIPAHVAFAYLTGAGHIAAGLAVLFGVLPRLAATMEAVMIGLFVLLLHLPAAIAGPPSRLNWTMVFVATALSGAVWNIAATLADKPWLWTRFAPPPPKMAIVRPTEWS
jgi:uncharacterized membrane protein